METFIMPCKATVYNIVTEMRCSFDMSRNIFSGCEAYLKAEGHHILTLV
jgi:hypothetical protein